MPIKYFLPLIGLLSLGVFACNKNDGENQNLNPDSQSSFDFMSAKAGCSWKYAGRDGVTYTRYARGRDTMKLGLKYSYYERKDDSALGFQPEYFGRNGDGYLTLIDLDGSELNYINYLFWKDHTTVGASWDNTGEINSPVGKVTIRISSEVAEDSLNMTIGMHTYKNVVHVSSNIKGGPFNTGIGKVDIWFSKSIGVIREEADINILGQYQVQHTDSLIDYYLVP